MKLQHLLGALLLTCAFHTHADDHSRTVSVSNYHDVLNLFNEIGYTAKQWQAGIREVPRVEIMSIPARWQTESQHIPVKEKKTIFFRLAGSGVLLANEKIAAERKTLQNKIKQKSAASDPWTLELARKYKVAKDETQSLTPEQLDKLLLRVDTVPPSLALAQAAEESGWGTSRFTIQGNALFGQWDFSGKGMKPKEQRAELGNYGLASFDKPLLSVEAYLLNLNTNRAYKKLRDKRAAMRNSGKKPSGWELAKTLDKYSERGTAYIDTLHTIMRVNKLAATDDAYLWEKGTIRVEPTPDQQ
ncbi:glucosaminidase domain-containing protein [Pseudomaricurvus sp. HS19]|uniref:glucosaminidase domain-containing protein n=1 Tax=Pseudomaricurvus sp. HS19 TaxID=2692626 RepID=UPI00136B840D|nr:glucosaminidase domain-containing protein [Pseudomaricurvus sp. HS19]MYM62950.1 glucosaminidase [Pseudomaricurvus sp. HS19]